MGSSSARIGLVYLDIQTYHSFECLYNNQTSKAGTLKQTDTGAVQQRW